MTNFLKTKKEITNWLVHYGVRDYILVEDPIYGFVVNARNVNLYEKNLKEIPVKFNKVSGGFYFHHNKLTSLEFCPTTVGGDFLCDGNHLTSLEFCPKIVRGNFSCAGNQLISLEYCPLQVRGNFYCKNNPALGETQQINSFADILNLHKDIVKIKKEKESIENALGKVGGVDGLPYKSVVKL